VPSIFVNWIAGRTREQKQELVTGITDVMHRVSGTPVERINVVLNDIPQDNWGRGGVLVSSLQSGPPTPVARAEPAAALHAGKVSLPLMDQQVRIFDLEQPRFEGMPVIAAHHPGYLYFLHRRHGDDYDLDLTGPRSSASGVIVCMEHSGTHVDALSHQADAQVMFGGVPADDCNGKGFKHLGVEEVPPIFAPAVLLDIAAVRGVPALDAGYLISVSDLEAACARAKVEIQPGDVVLVRTGNGGYWREPDRYLSGPGMSGAASQWLAAKQVLAVGADNMAWDVIGLRDASLNCLLPGHLILLARFGIYIIENLQLEDLAAAGYGRFTFVYTPLKFTGATGSPVRPLAIVGGSD
jgi:4-oxalocrotonate tautomerase family enzyme